MTRLHIFRELKNDAFFGKFFKKLSTEEIRICEEFIANNSQSVSDFEYALNRLFLDKEKPRHWKEILELLLSANIRFRHLTQKTLKS